MLKSVIEQSELLGIRERLRKIKELRQEEKYSEADIIRKDLIQRGLKIEYRKNGSIQWGARIRDNRLGILHELRQE